MGASSYAVDPRTRPLGPNLERGLILGAGAIAALGFVLVCLALGIAAGRVVRIGVLTGSLLAAAAVMDAGCLRRERLLLPLAAMLCGIGAVALWRVDAYAASKQLLWVMLGSTLMVGTFYLVDDPRRLAQLKYVSGATAVLLLLATMLFGVEVNGAKLWLGTGMFRFQPGEPAKVLMCIFLAGYLADRAPLLAAGERSPHWLVLPRLRHIGPLALVAAFCLAMFVVQRDLGAAALFFGLFVAMLCIATGRLSYALIGVGLFLLGAGVAASAFDHVHERVAIWLNPWADPDGSGYQIVQSLFGLGTGGVFGVGLGHGLLQEAVTPTAVSTDFIFVGIGEELGLAGTCAVVALYLAMIYRGFRIGWRARDAFCGLLAAALSTVLAIQTLAILAGLLRLVPLTGITLPFISYGGSSLITNFIALGLLLAISRDAE
ncbi:MAG: FtsW/RodA/SpoVE family cell cycle protein [Armatimonadota bacterium]